MIVFPASPSVLGASSACGSTPLACSALAWLRVYRKWRWSSTQMSTRAAGNREEGGRGVGVGGRGVRVQGYY